MTYGKRHELMAGGDIMKCGIAGLTVFVGMTVAAHSQSISSDTLGEPVHPGTAILDSMGISAGAQGPTGRPVHPGTAILDSMGIFAGMPVADRNSGGNAVVASPVNPK